MKPKQFKVEIYNKDERYVKETSTGHIWHRCQHRPLYADTDRSSVVYHSNYLRYFELGRATLMRDNSYPYFDIEENGYVYPIIDTRLQYYCSLRYDDLMWIYTRPGDIERVKLQFEYIITHADSGEISCIGYTRHCALNKSNKPVAIDPMTVDLWKTFPKNLK